MPENSLLKCFQTLQTLNSDQKRVVYAYLCTLAIGSLASILSFGFGATLMLFLSPFIKTLFALPNISEEIEPEHYQFADGRVLPASIYLGYFKRLYILFPSLILSLFLLMVFCLDYDFFGLTAFLLIFSYHTVLSAYLVQHKLPLLSTKHSSRSSEFEIAPLKSKLWEHGDRNKNVLNNPLINCPSYSHIPGNIHHRS